MSHNKPLFIKDEPFFIEDEACNIDDNTYEELEKFAVDILGIELMEWQKKVITDMFSIKEIRTCKPDEAKEGTNET